MNVTSSTKLPLTNYRYYAIKTMLMDFVSQYAILYTSMVCAKDGDSVISVTIILMFIQYCHIVIFCFIAVCYQGIIIDRGITFCVFIAPLFKTVFIAS